MKPFEYLVTLVPMLGEMEGEISGRAVKGSRSSLLAFARIMKDKNVAMEVK